MVVYHVVCFFPVLLLRVNSDNVAFVRICSTSSICLLHGLVLLPCGISGKMTITLEITSIIACWLFALSLCLRYLPPVYHASHIAMSASNHPFLANRCLAKYRFCSALLIALLVAGEDEVGSMLEHGYVGISQYLLYY